MYVIKFQKRGLPHCHSLFTLGNASKIRDNVDVDRAICAKIPDPQVDLELYMLVAKHIICSPCGHLNPNSVCMKNGCCSKKFPRPFQQGTVITEHSYPLYQRRDNGIVVQKHVGNQVIELDNCFVVPYSPFLLKHFAAHINVEICSSIKSIKYMYKYLHKGHDTASIQVTNDKTTANYDEVTTHQSTHYVAVSEAAWRIFEFKMHGISHWILKLDIHLPGPSQYILTKMLLMKPEIVLLILIPCSWDGLN